jgi:hypothetical protein
MSVSRLAHVPEQQTDPRPVHGGALQEPQCNMSVLRSVQTLEQQAGVLPEHLRLHSPQLFVSMAVLAHVPPQQVGWVA